MRHPHGLRSAAGAAGGDGGGETIFIGSQSSPHIQAYPWSSSTGFGAKFSNPASAVGAAVNSVDVNTENSAVVVGTGGTPYVKAYAWSNTTGFGTKYTDPTSTGTSNKVDFSPNSLGAISVEAGSPYIHGWQWSNSTGFGTKSSNPATLPTGAGNGCAFSGDSAYVAVAHNVSPFISVYPWSSSGFGTKVANPSTLPTGGPSTLGMTDCVFAGTSALLMTSYASPYIQAYAWSSGFGSKFSNPATLPPSSCYKIRMNRANTAVAVSSDSPPYIVVYAWSGSGFGTKYSDPSTASVYQEYEIDFSKNDTAIAQVGTYNGATTNEKVMVWAWSNSTGFGTKYSAPTTLPAGTALAVKFSS